MGNLFLPFKFTTEQKAALADAASIGEAAGLATLIRQYEAGEDMTEILQQLLNVQESKRRAGIDPVDMRAAQDRPNPRRALVGIRAHARVRQILRDHVERRAN